jgi:shikimate kinase
VARYNIPVVNTLLIGARASGKSAIGRLLARRLVRPFVDLDDLALVRFAEATVQEVWTAHGEAAWRQAELKALTDVLTDDGQIVAMGGGTPMIDEARERVDSARRAGRARVVYLQCSAAELSKRLRRMPGDRPSLTGADPADEIADVLATRERTYRTMSDFVVESDRMSPEMAADRIAAMLASAGS